MTMTHRAAALGGALLAAPMLAASPAHACASCGCTLTSDWLSQGLVSQPGTTVGLRYDYIPQTLLHTDTRAVTDAEKALPNDREIEAYTYNHVVTASIDHQFASDWGVNVQLPIVTRPHRTVTEGETDPSFSRAQGVGDLRITARWQGLSSPGRIVGLQAGLVLPTGHFHEAFRSGPEAGNPVDRGLQPGTGTTQVAVGAYAFGTLAPTVDYIVQVQGQVALNRRELYKPGASADISAGLQYTGWRGITPQVEVNFRTSARDSGDNSDRPNSGGDLLNVSPGLVASISPRVSAYAFMQLPLYRRVNGFQLVPRFSTSVGLQLRL
ncbi:transporter [Novosphingobium lentum]|uniref:transporter n=1 Tax=Novosphingobium lentum TaxID=145287 RepID=UPI00082CE1EE|nr:transporter [Novosphingobium lentum]